MDLSLEHFRTRNDIVPEDDLLAGSPELEDRQQLTAGHKIFLDGVIDARTEHLPRIAARAMPRWDIEAIGLGAPLRVQRKRHLLHANRVVERVPPIFRPQAVFTDAHQALHPDLSDAGCHAARFHRLAARQRILTFDARIARDALLRHACGSTIHRLFVGALFHALLVAAAPVLVDQHDPVFWSLVDRLPRAGRQAAWIRAVVADPLEIEEEGLMLR